MSDAPEPAWVGESLDKYRQASLELSTARAYRHSFEEFVDWLRGRGVSYAKAYPRLVTAWVVHKCEMLGNTASARQWRAHVEGHVRYFRRSEHIAWTADDWLTFDMTLKGMRKVIGSKSVQPPPLTDAILRRVHAVLKPRAPAPDVPRAEWRDWYYWVYLLVMQQSMLRPNEACSGALLVKDVELVPRSQDNPPGFRLMVHGFDRRGDKAAKRDGRPVGKPVYCVRRSDELDVFVPLRFLLSSEFKLDAERPLLTMPDDDGNLTNRLVTPDDMTTWLRASLKRAGVEHAATYTIRSGRSGRRTDLQDAGVEREVVNSLGRWSGRYSNDAYRRMSAGVMNQLPTGKRGRSEEKPQKQSAKRQRR